MATIDLRRQLAQDQERRGRLTGIALAILAIVVAVVLLASNPSLLVALTSDRDGQALLPASTLAPGSTVTGRLTLANEGLLPLDYRVVISAGSEEKDAGVRLRIRKLGTGRDLYQGPITSRPIPVGRLLPGQRDQLEVVLQAPPSQSTNSVPVDDTFTWTGRSPGLGYWWWLVLIALILLILAFLLPRVLDLYARLRRLTPLPYERFWRVPLLLGLLLLAALVPLAGVSFASVNVQSYNPSNTFAVGTLALSDRARSGTTCISLPGSRFNGQPGGGCDAIFAFGKMQPGQSARALVTIRNLGSVPVGKLLLSTDGCTPGDAPSEVGHGRADICSTIQLSIHDDSHNVCYFPVTQPGECPTLGGDEGAVLGFARAHGRDQALSLNPMGLGAGITYSFTLALDPAAGNDSQGRAISADYFWEIVSAQ